MSGSSVPEVTAQELLSSGKKVVFVDVRREEEYTAEHIPDSIWIPLNELENRYGEISKEDEVVLVCRSGQRSEVACKYLGQQGYTRVYNLVGGMLKWTGDVESGS